MKANATPEDLCTTKHKPRSKGAEFVQAQENHRMRHGSWRDKLLKAANLFLGGGLWPWHVEDSGPGMEPMPQ